MENMTNNIGDRIVLLRNQKGLSQLQLASALNISSEDIIKWENKETIPDYNLIVRMAELFSVRIDYLIKGEKENINRTSNNSMNVKTTKTISVVDNRTGVINNVDANTFYNDELNKLRKGKKNAYIIGIVFAIILYFLSSLFLSIIYNQNAYYIAIIFALLGFADGAAIHLKKISSTPLERIKIKNSGCLRLILTILFFGLMLIVYLLQLIVSPIFFIFYLIKTNKLIEKYENEICK